MSLYEVGGFQIDSGELIAYFAIDEHGRFMLGIGWDGFSRFKTIQTGRRFYASSG